MKIRVSTIALLLASFIAQAQDETDAILFSQTQAGTTARSMAIGGALGSIGADFAALNINPAGLGRYSKDEITFTPAFNGYRTPASLNANKISSNNNKLNLQNVGWVTANRNEKSRGARSSGFALGINRLADFNRDYEYSGTTKHSSMMDAVAARINDAGGSNYIISSTPYLEDVMAFNSYLIDADPNNTSKVRSYVPLDNLEQRKVVSTRGGINELTMGLGANFNDNIYFGASIGLPFTRYENNSTYSETDVSGNLTNQFNYFQQDVFRSTSGLGFNAKIGLVFLPKESPWRIGAALHTPTWHNLRDEYRFRIKGDLENVGTPVPRLFDIGDVTGVDSRFALISDYSLNTPLKGVLSASYVVGKSGFITADVDVVNYKSARIKYDNDPAYSRLMQQVITNEHRIAPNVRLGAEARAGNISFRGGAAAFGSPYARDSKYSGGARYQLGGGIGFRSTSFFADAAYVYRWQFASEFPYVFTNTAGQLNDAANVGRNAGQFALTIGWKY
jgi:hypothetical protein